MERDRDNPIIRAEGSSSWDYKLDLRITFTEKLTVTYILFGDPRSVKRSGGRIQERNFLENERRRSEVKSKGIQVPTEENVVDYGTARHERSHM